MSEGELKKQVNLEFKTAYNACYSDMFSACFTDFKGQSQIAGMLNTGLKPNIEKIIDDAKKVFPKFAVIESYEGDWKPEDILEMRNKEIKNYQNFKKKWFGDSE